MKNRTAAPAVISVVCALLAATALHAAVNPVSRRDAARLQAKIEKLAKNGAGRSPAAPLRTPVTEGELNSYLRYEVPDKLPAGVTEPWVSMLGDNRVTGQAIVDLSQVAQGHKSSGMMDPYNFLTGSLPISAHGILKSKNGVASFSLESASISGVPVPVWM